MINKKTNLSILTGISSSHLLNDMLQSLIVAVYPILQGNFSLSFAQIGLITFTYQCTASLFQPLIGIYTDKHPKPYSLPVGMGLTFIGLLLLAFSSNYPMVLAAAALVGLGSAIFHPEASRIARMASGGSYGFAQSFFQVGGNFGTSLGPLLAAIFITPFGMRSVSYFSVFALLGILVLLWISKWYSAQQNIKSEKERIKKNPLPKKRIVFLLSVLLLLVFSKAFYLSSLTSYYAFYLMDKFSLSEQTAQIYLFVFLFAVAVGTFIGGPIGDRIGRKYVIWISILGVAPFTLLLPYTGLQLTIVLSVVIGLVLSSAFSAMLVYAQELLPGRVGMISGLFFGFSFGMGGLGAALLGRLADQTSIEYVYRVCSYLPLLGLLAVFLPNNKKVRS